MKSTIKKYTILAILYVIIPFMLMIFLNDFIYIGRMLYCSVLFFIAYQVTKQKMDIFLQIFLYLIISTLFLTFLLQGNLGYWRSMPSIINDRIVLYVFEVAIISIGGFIKIYKINKKKIVNIRYCAKLI